MKLLCFLLVGIILFIPTVVNAEGKKIAADDQNVKYVGRWVKNDKGYMEGSFECMAELRFNGTYLKAQKGTQGSVYIAVDGGEYQRKDLSSATYYAKELSEGEHTVKIYARAQQGFPVLSGFETDGTLLAPIKKPLIEFIGDSILEGYTVDPTLNSVLSSYGHLVGDILDFDRNIVAFGGITVTPNYGNPDKLGMVNRYYLQKEYTTNESDVPKWDTSLFVPDHIVINLGTNDGAPKTNEFITSYLSFLTNLRKDYPQAEIYIMTPFTGRRNAEIHTVYLMQNDEKMHLIDSYKWNIKAGTDNIHLTVDGHKQVAELLAREIKAVIEKPEATVTPEADSATQVPTNTIEATEAPNKDGGTSGAVVGAAIGVGAVAVGAGTAAVVIKKKKKK